MTSFLYTSHQTLYLINYFVINIIVLFGAIQGFTLCLYLLMLPKENPKAFRAFVLFLFALSFFNLRYALLYMQVESIGFIPLASFPFPYKYLIGVGFYFYLKSLIEQKAQVISKVEYLLFIPAILYGLLRTYWYFQLHSGLDKEIFRKVYQSGFFVYNEFVYLIFNLVLMLIAIRFQKSRQTRIKGSVSKLKNWAWLLKFSWVFTTMIIVNLLHQIIATLFNLEGSGQFYYLILVLNSMYIYWLGFIGFTKSNLLFKTFKLKEAEKVILVKSPLKVQLENLINQEGIYTNQNLKVSDLAKLLEVNEKDLSLFIHENYGMSFTDYINFHRVEKVKTLLLAPEQERFTLLALAEQAGFSSKSSFNAVFKKVTGLTPTQYKKTHPK